MKKIITFISVFFLLASFSACNKGEGVGGLATIQGKVMVVIHDNDNYNLSVDTMVAAKTDVFIVYGDNELYGDDMKTGANGCYRFKYLKKGTYTLYAYSTLPSGEKIAVSQTVNVSGDEVVEVPTIYTHEGKAYGTSLVRGQIWANYYHNGDLRGNGWAYEQRVYIRRVGEPYHFDDVRVGADGYYYFQQLSPGEYEVYTFTEDMNEIPSPLFKTVTVSEAENVYDVEMFSIVVNV
ncbi:MAG: hypothetical protein MJZ76_02240 [Bacteroidales bacterium]|nr:hypothetical protein [Bacteroidales bacterium]